MNHTDLVMFYIFAFCLGGAVRDRIPYWLKTRSTLKSRESLVYLTIAELIEHLDDIEDKTCVVVDRDGNPITSISAGSDSDFGTVFYLRGFESNRRIYREGIRKAKS